MLAVVSDTLVSEASCNVMLQVVMTSKLICQWRRQRLVAPQLRILSLTSMVWPASHYCYNGQVHADRQHQFWRPVILLASNSGLARLPQQP